MLFPALKWTVWNIFNCKNFLYYHDIYFISVVLLLADIWAYFRNVCPKIYEIDCCNHYTAPSLSWDTI